MACKNCGNVEYTGGTCQVCGSHKLFYAFGWYVFPFEVTFLLLLWMISMTLVLGLANVALYMMIR